MNPFSFARRLFRPFTRPLEERLRNLLGGTRSEQIVRQPKPTSRVSYASEQPKLRVQEAPKAPRISVKQLSNALAQRPLRVSTPYSRGLFQKPKPAPTLGERFSGGIREVKTAPREFVSKYAPGAQSVIRTPETFLRSIAGLSEATSARKTSRFDTSEQTGIRRFLYGKDPIKTYQTTAEELSGLGRQRFGKGGNIAYFAGPLLAVADLTGGKGKAATKLVDDVVKASTQEALEKALAKAAKRKVRLSPEATQKILREGVGLTDRNVTKRIVDQGIKDVVESRVSREILDKAITATSGKQFIKNLDRNTRRVLKTSGEQSSNPLVQYVSRAIKTKSPQSLDEAITSLPPTLKAPDISAQIKSLSPQAKVDLDDVAQKLGMKNADQLVEATKPRGASNIAEASPPPLTSISPDDPFGNRSIIQRIRNEAGSLVDDDAAMIRMLRKAEKETGRKGLVNQWYFDTGNIRSSNTIANARLRNSPELREAFGGLSKKELRELDTYTAARAELKNYEGLPTSRTPEQNAAIVRQLEGKYSARFEAQNRYWKGIAQEAYDAGLIDKERLAKYLSSDDYVRIQRDMEDLVNPRFGGSRARSLGITKLGQKRTGSEREILPPSQSLPKRTQEIQLEIQRNKAASNTIDLLEELGMARPVKDTTRKNTISRLVEGKRQIYEVPGDIKRVMDNVNPYHLGVISRIVSAPVRLFRAGTTALSAPFTVTNYLRDQASSAIYSKSILATHNPQNIISGLGSAARDFAGESRSPLWKKFEEFAGDQTIYDELRNAANTKRLLKEVRRGKFGKLSNMVTSPIRTLEDLNSITEKATRFQNFKGIYKKTLKATGDEQEAIKAAVLAARQNSVDFQRSSAFTRALNLFIPYFNAAVQGSRNTARSFKTRPIATAMKSVGFVAAPSVGVTAWNFSDENRRKAYDSINEFEKEDNFIIVGPNARQREDGSWEGIYKIPKPQGYRELTDPVRDVAEAFFRDEPVENVAGMFKDMLGGLTGPIDITDAKKLAGSFIPQQAKPWIQLAMNRDLYTGSEVVPEFMLEETDDPAKRAYEGTSGTARLIANQIGVSPIQVEKAISDIMGSLGRYGINIADTALAAAGKIPKEQIGGRSIASDFSRRLFEASGKLLDENKKPGRRYYENVKAVSELLNKNDKAAFNSVHPSKTNFLGEDIFDENKRISKYTRAGAYLNHPNVFEADRQLDLRQRQQGNPGNPLFDLPKPLATKVLLKDALPPGAKDPELSNLWKEPWYQDYQNARSKYYDKVKASMAKEGKSFPKATNPYPETPPNLQKVMDYYSSLPKGTGERSAWINANPGLWQQMTAQWAQVDAWENKERVAIGLAPVVEESRSRKKKAGSTAKGGTSAGARVDVTNFFSKSGGDLSQAFDFPDIRFKAPTIRIPSAASPSRLRIATLSLPSQRPTYGGRS